MINPKSRSLEWITEAARQIGVRDIALVEKTIRAFSLLEVILSCVLMMELPRGWESEPLWQ